MIREAPEAVLQAKGAKRGSKITSSAIICADQLYEDTSVRQ